MTEKSNRNGMLDILRALAILLVVNCHIASYCSDTVGSHAIYRVLGLGGHGVDLFFVMSGWLLGGILFKEWNRTGKVNIKRFLARRWMRTLPAYYVVLALTLAQLAISAKLPKGSMSYVLFLQTYYLDALPFLGVSWSLCVEEHFYLLIAAMFWFSASKRGRTLACLVLCVSLPELFRYLDADGTSTQSHVRIDQCAAGVLLAYCFTFHSLVWNWFQRLLPLLCTIAILLLAFLTLNRLGVLKQAEHAWIFTLIAITAVGFAERSNFFRQLSIPGIHYLATRSYSLYLLHVEGLWVCKRLSLEHPILIFAVAWVVGLLLAELLYRFVEKPIMDLRDR